MSRAGGGRTTPRSCGVAFALLVFPALTAGPVACASGGDQGAYEPGAAVPWGGAGGPADDARRPPTDPGVPTPDLDSLRAAGPVDTHYDEGPSIVPGDWLPRLLERRLLPVIEAEDLPPSTGARYWLLVAADGRVADAVLHTRSGSEAFDAEARETALELQYRPATRDGRRVPVWILARISLLLR